MKRCVFFDRDGIVNRSPGPGYVTCWEDFHLLPYFPDVLRIVKAKGYEAVVITNQRGVDLGHMDAETVEEIHEKMRQHLRESHDVDVLDVFYCPHGAEGCDCRKPKPGMLLAASLMHDIDLEASWMIGDAERDVAAGKQAGCKTILVSETVAETTADHAVHSMEELAVHIGEWI